MFGSKASDESGVYVVPIHRKTWAVNRFLALLLGDTPVKTRFYKLDPHAAWGTCPLMAEVEFDPPVAIWWDQLKTMRIVKMYLRVEGFYFHRARRAVWKIDVIAVEPEDGKPISEDVMAEICRQQRQGSLVKTLFHTVCSKCGRNYDSVGCHHEDEHKHHEPIEVM